MEERNDALEMQEANVQTESLKCSGCGSNMNFDPETQMLKCSYCGMTESFEQSNDVQEIVFDENTDASVTWSDETIVYNCENCGARIVAEKAETAALCPFCGTSHVVATEDLQGLRPNVVVPFKFGKDALLEHFKKWAKRKLFAPSDFKKNLKADKVKGVYMPYFTFDSNTRSVYDGRVGDRRTRTVRTKNGTRTETYIVWRHISGSIEHFFDDVLVNACKHEEIKKMSKLAPFDWDSSRVYDSEYLSGYVAKHYERSMSECWKDARDCIDQELRDLIVAKHHADVIGYLNVSTHHERVTYKYALLPVYVISYSYKTKNYTIYSNGSTGKTVGKSPVSPWRVLIASIIGLVVAVCIGAQVYMGLMS